jgi:hypothetical protein
MMERQKWSFISATASNNCSRAFADGGELAHGLSPAGAVLCYTLGFVPLRCLPYLNGRVFRHVV